ncbi:MAG: FG-GAP repeat protein, partial [Acholeplasmataceae bacterium]
MLKKFLIIMMIALSSMHLLDVQANSSVLSQLPEAIQQTLYERLNNQEDNEITETKLTASDGAEDDRFGQEVLINGSTLVVSSRYDDDKETDSGSVYVYDLTKNSGDSGFERKITASDGMQADHFGRSIALEDTTLVISAHFDDDNGVQSGSVYVYDLTKNSGDEGFERKITASDGAAKDYFGHQIALEESTLVVSSHHDDDNGEGSGSVYVYDLTKTNADAGFETKITASDGVQGDNFSHSVAIYGTLLVVGAPKDDDNGIDSGSVYVYDLTKNSEDAGFETKITSSDGAVDDRFGQKVAIDGTTLVVSAFTDDDNGENSGSVYVYDITKNSGDEGFEIKITASDGANFDQFGYSVALKGATLVIGANLDSDNGFASGSVYIYDLTKNNGDAGFERKITASDSEESDHFGFSVAIDGTTLVVGSYNDDDNGTNSGSVYVYDLTKTSDDEGFETKITASDGAQSDYFGYSVAIDGTTLVVGAYNDNDNGTNSGSVYIYDL